jgi:hypothetical protein
MLSFALQSKIDKLNGVPAASKNEDDAFAVTTMAQSMLATKTVPVMTESEVNMMIPNINKKDMDMLMADDFVSPEMLRASEELTAIWISSYLDEVQRVETFFLAKIEELINQFILMQDKFRLKGELYEEKKQTLKYEKSFLIDSNSEEI